MRRRSGWAATLAGLALLVLAAGPVRAQETKDPAELLSKGRDLYEAGDYDGAREALWAYLDATAQVTGPSRLPQAEALWYIALMEPDASVAANHYKTIVEEYPAASVADQALFRLGVYALVDGRTEEARDDFQRLQKDYPFSRVQPELQMWIGRTYLAEDQTRPAIDQFLQGFTKVKGQDLPMELPVKEREALAAEYAYWLGTAYRQAGDATTAQQYYTLLTLDYPDSPQSGDAREALASLRRGEAGEGAREMAMAPPAREERPAGVEPAPADSEAAAREPVPPVTREPAAKPVERPAERPAARQPAERPVEQPAERQPVERPAEKPAERPAQKPAEDQTPVKLPPAGGERTVWLQVGAFTSATNAAELSKRLKADGFDARVQVGLVDGQGYYRVRIGPFRLPGDRSGLEDNRNKLDAKGYPTREVSGEE